MGGMATVPTYSAGRKNMVKGCVTKLATRATFDHVFMASRVRTSHSHFAGPIRLPLLGSVLFLDVRNLGKSFKRLGSRYGDIFSIFIGRKPCVVLNSYPVIKEAFAIPEFNGRPAMFSGTFFQKGKDGIITSEGSMWEAQREFFHQRMVDLVRGKGTQGFQV